MILDKLLIFSEGETVTSTKNSAVLDFGEAGDAVGQELTLEVRTASAFTGSGGTLQIKLQTSSDNFSSDATDVVLSPSITVNGLKAGHTLFKIRVPQGLKRYARLAYTVGGTISAGSVTAFLTKDL